MTSQTCAKPRTWSIASTVDTTMAVRTRRTAVWQIYGRSSGSWSDPPWSLPAGAVLPLPLSYCVGGSAGGDRKLWSRTPAWTLSWTATYGQLPMIPTSPTMSGRTARDRRTGINVTLTTFQTSNTPSNPSADLPAKSFTLGWHWTRNTPLTRPRGAAFTTRHQGSQDARQKQDGWPRTLPSSTPEAGWGMSMMIDLRPVGQFPSRPEAFHQCPQFFVSGKSKMRTMIFL
mmetsp:Transcript_20994/g.37553  ORF Transcript_20994/g.37553 Transcript_20994/m.37553 type:complete len:229 (+) Transcript_20994:152-838(+)